MTFLRQALIALLVLLPVAAVDAGKSYSSGGSKSSSSSGTRSSSSGTRSSSSGGKSYSSGSSSSRPSSSSSSSRPSSSPSSRPSSSSSSRPSSSAATKPSKPAGSSYDSKAANAARHSESRSSYENRGTNPGGKRYGEGNVAPSKPTYTPGSSPRSTYNDYSGRAQTIDPRDRKIDQLRRDLNEERWFNRQHRSTVFFGGGYGPPLWWGPRVVYADPYSDMFFWWMLSQSLDYRASWAYHHRYDMDSLRYRDLMERDRQLEARVRELEAKQVPRDPTYRPKEIDPDLMYTDDYVAAAVNPTITQQDSVPQRTSSGGHFFRSCFTWLLAIGIIVFLIWFIFFKRWGGSEPVQGRKVRP